MSATPLEQAGASAIPGYEDFQVIGRGGFATVYRARQPEYDRMVAVKVVELGIDDDAVRRRFRRECAASGRLTGHPNILSVLDAGFLADGRPFLTMPLCPGGSVAARVERAGPLPIDEGLRIGVKIAGALQTAHNHGVVHRDIKPENILLNGYGEAVLADFGIATIAARSATKRTQAYTPTHAPPEVLLGELATEPSDIYTLGSTLYELLAGAPAFTDTGQAGLALFVDHVLNSGPPPLPRADAPASLSRALGIAMAKRPTDRYSSAAAFGAALQDVQRELGLPVTELTVGEPAATTDVPVEPATMPATALGQRAASLGTSLAAPATQPRLRRRAPLLIALGLVLLLAVGGITAAVLLGGSASGDGESGGGGSVELPSASDTAGDGGPSGGAVAREDSPAGAARPLDTSRCPSSADLSEATGVHFAEPEPVDPAEFGSTVRGTGCGYGGSRLILFHEPGVDLDQAWNDDAPGAPVVISARPGDSPAGTSRSTSATAWSA